eukprot:6211198-Pleurochrysis_carterae.AAC.8
MGGALVATASTSYAARGDSAETVSYIFQLWATTGAAPPRTSTVHYYDTLGRPSVSLSPHSMFLYFPFFHLSIFLSRHCWGKLIFRSPHMMVDPTLQYLLCNGKWLWACLLDAANYFEQPVSDYCCPTLSEICNV